MGHDMLSETLRDRLPRLFAAGVDYNDAQIILGRITRMEDWHSEWERLAQLHEQLGADALASGHLVSAGAAFQRAALYFHFAQFVYFADTREKRRLQERQAAAYLRAAPHLSPPAAQLEVPFEGRAFRGNLRLPVGADRPPCVLLNPGADSTKEEFHTLEDEFLARGLATFSYDGPGQGLSWAEMKLRPDFEAPISAGLDLLVTCRSLDTERIGIWGRSFGAYAAMRGATDPRIRACIGIGGFYDMGAIWNRMPMGTMESLSFAFGAADLQGAAEQARRYTLRGVLGRIGCPLLVVHSGQDNVCPVTESQRMIEEARSEAELKIFPEGNHVCDNIPYKARPLMADWMADKLRDT